MWRKYPNRSRIVFYLVLLLLVALFLPSSAMAHKPIFASPDITSFERAMTIPDPLTSYAIYGDLTSPQQVHIYKVTLDQEMPFYARLSVPKRDVYDSFRPALVLFGPGLSKTHEPPNFPLSLPEDMGRAVVLAGAEEDEFFEPFTQTTYVQRQMISRTLPAGTYYLAVYDPSGQVGKYTLATGKKEEFGLQDWLRFPVTWFRVRMWYDAAQTWLMLLLGVGAILGGLAYFRNMRQ